MRGDHDAFAQLVDAAFPKLYGTAGLVLGEWAAVQEAVQSTLIRAWQDLPKLRDPERFEAWLYRIAINACHDEGRRRQRGRRHETDLGSLDSDPSLDSLTWVADRDELDRAFARLTPDQRAILTLVFYRDMTVLQAAEAIGAPLGTAKSRLHRALEALRAALAAEGRPAFESEVEA